MKKIVTILLSLALLMGCAAALAETAEKTTIGEVSINGEFTIQAPIPEGYTMEITRADEIRIQAEFTPADAAKPTLKLSIGWEDAWETGIKLNDVDEADLQAIEYSFYWEDPDFQISYTETAHGTKLLVAKLPDNSTVYIYTLYEGYEIEFKLVSADPAGLTQEQIDTCIQFLSDMDFVPNVK